MRSHGTCERLLFNEESISTAIKGSLFASSVGAIGGTAAAALTNSPLAATGSLIGVGFGLYTFLQAAFDYPNFTWGVRFFEPRLFMNNPYYDIAKSQVYGSGLAYLAAYFIDPKITSAVAVHKFMLNTALSAPISLATLITVCLAAVAIGQCYERHQFNLNGNPR